MADHEALLQRQEDYSHEDGPEVLDEEERMRMEGTGTNLLRGGLR
jgi:hypothetical protein